jgi:hypothetical protein
MERKSGLRVTERHLSSDDGAIDPAVLYRLDELKRRVGWRDAAFRAAVRAGLTIHRSGKRVFIVGSDLIAFITRSKGVDR